MPSVVFDFESEASVPDNLTDVIDISADGFHSLALKSDGSVVAWGYNADGQIDIPEVSADSLTTQTATNDQMVEAISFLLADASLEKGEKIFKKCGACHNYKKDGKSKIGPNLWDLINRQKASVSGFAYSKALSDYGGKWTFEELNGFLYKPKEYIQGTKMNFAGLNNVEDRADLILWLRQYSDNPVPLP